jgi:hypothetical protein
MSMLPAAFFDELAKIKSAAGVLRAGLDRLKKVDPWWIPVGLTAVGGGASYLRNRPEEGGRSAPEQASLAVLNKPDMSLEEELQALKKHRKNVSNEELAGGALATVGGSIAGWGGKELLKRKLMAQEKGWTTSPETAKALHDAILPTDGAAFHQHPSGMFLVQHPDKSAVAYSPEFTLMQGRHIPPESHFGRLSRDRAINDMLHAGVKPELIVHGLEHGATVLPGAANPHVAAHELGHAAFTLKPYSKALRRASMPLALGSSLASGAMSFSDPDSTSAKLAPAVAAAGLAPMLGEEAYASIKGIQGMRKAGLPPEVIRHGMAQGARAWGTYAMKYGLPAVAFPYIVRKVRQYRMGQREKAGLETSRDLTKRIEALQGNE